MKQAVIILITFALVWLTGCSNAPEKSAAPGEPMVYKNNDKPAEPGLKLEPKLVLTIQGTDESIENEARQFIWPRYLDVDSQGNVYILDNPSSSVKKFSPKGEFIRSFGSEGEGPGEVRRPYLLVVSEDIVWVADAFTRRMALFDTDGKFIRNVVMKRGMPNYMQTAGKDRFIAHLANLENKDGQLFNSFDLELMDKEFNRVKLLQTYRRKADPKNNDFLEKFSAYAVGKDTIYVAKNSKKEYVIEALDFDGKLKYTITKDYSAISFNDWELKELNDTLEAFYKKVNVQSYSLIRSGDKKAISYLFCDKDERLWVASSMKRNQDNQHDYMVDVFDRGKFLNRVTLPGFKGHDYLLLQEEKIFFKGGNIYFIDEPKAEVRIYSY